MAGLVLPMSIIPTIMTTKQLHLYGTYLNLILLYIAFNTRSVCLCIMDSWRRFLLLWMRPRSSTAAVRYPCFPGDPAVAQPVTVTSVLIIATGIWNDFYYQLYFTRSSDMWAMPMTVYTIISDSTAGAGTWFARILSSRWCRF